MNEQQRTVVSGASVIRARTDKEIAESQNAEIISESLTEDTVLSNVEDLLQDYYLTHYRMRSGYLFQFQNLGIEDFAFAQSPQLRQALEDRNVEPTDTAAVEQFLSSLNEQDQVELLYSTDVMKHIMRIIAKAVTSIQFSEKPQSECPIGVISLQRFTDSEIIQFFTAILQFSVEPERFIAKG